MRASGKIRPWPRPRAASSPILVSDPTHSRPIAGPSSPLPMPAARTRPVIGAQGMESRPSQVPPVPSRPSQSWSTRARGRLRPAVGLAGGAAGSRRTHRTDTRARLNWGDTCRTIGRARPRPIARATEIPWHRTPELHQWHERRPCSASPSVTCSTDGGPVSGRRGARLPPPGFRYTYRQLQVEVDRCARALIALGVDKGQRVGIWAPNCAEWAITQFATSKIGAILVNINPSYRLDEVQYALAQSGCA